MGRVGTTVPGRRRFLALCTALALAPRALAQQESTKDANREPRGVYARISLRGADEMIDRLSAPYGSDRRAAIQEVLGRPTAFISPVLYALANALAEEQPEQAIFWYHVGRLRAVYDALRCRDKTVRAAFNFLRGQLGPELVRIQVIRPDRLVRLAQKAVEWDAANPRDYDHRWIALFGQVSLSSPGTDPDEVTVPESEWPAILKYVHQTHLESVLGFVAEKSAK